MDRRTFNKLTGMTAMVAFAERSELYGQSGGAGTPGFEIVLEDKELLVAFDKNSGALTRMARKSRNWLVERRPELGVSFRLLAPLPQQRANFIYGQKQTAAKVEKVSSSQVQIVWRDPVSQHGGVVPLTLAATATLENGVLTFTATLENNSALTLETLDYPYFGDLNAPTRDAPLSVEHMWTGAMSADEIYPHFSGPGGSGYWGILYPTKTINGDPTFQTQFCLIQSSDQGIYVGVHDPAIRYFSQFTFEQHPGVIDWNDNAVPRTDEISGLPVHLDFRVCHFVYAHPKSKVDLAPVVVHPYSGDWHAGLDVYKEWRASWFPKAMIPAWAADVNSWLQLQIDGSEQDYSIPYRELAKFGTECAENGVTAIQLVGWHHGGQDGGEPRLDTDPGLGTWQELHDAIAQIQAKGVKMILFAKPVFADMSTDWYKRELYKYDCIDPYGNKYESGSFGYNTPPSLTGIDRRRRAIMDVCCQQYRDIATREFEKILALGAQGWLFDEVMQHNGVAYNFSADHGYTPPGFLFGSDIPLVKQFRAAADKVNPEFLFSGEGPGDWLMPYYALGYYRIGAGTRHALRYIDSQAPLMAAVRGFNARDEVNLALAYRYIIEYEPYNFKGHVTDFPLTLEYGKKVDALRRKYREFLWDAEFRDTLGATVNADGNFRYAVYVAKSGKRGVVVVNLEQGRPISANLALPNAGRLSVATPESQDAQPASGAIAIPARSAAVIMEL
jgi:Domain of unknown function (DUF6259)